ncbi:MAG: hypothetical protein KA144_16565 [Xanthomonadaceae bacterium]|nr:hypothetical protein [Xanthomonadaceae bacterium]
MSAEKLSGSTFFIKRVFPVFWFGFLAMFVTIGLVSTTVDKKAFIPFLLMPLAMAVLGFFLFRALVWDLADEVSLLGDQLLVRKNGVEDRIRLADIMNVSVSQMTNPVRVSLRLRKIGKFGDEVVFMPRARVRFNPFARNPIAEKLISLVDRARL